MGRDYRGRCASRGNYRAGVDCGKFQRSRHRRAGVRRNQRSDPTGAKSVTCTVPNRLGAVRVWVRTARNSPRE